MAGLPVWRLYCRYFGGDLNTHLNVHSVLDLALRRSFSSSQRAEFVSADEAKVRYVEALNKMYPSWNEHAERLGRAVQWAERRKQRGGLYR
ncbi:unnamed protein product [Vitrella brassicaformis CCMP3155]|uniref:ACB domain-containing protein n=1 Tax=Vitrella brassicaformis (strain CCMP3155) TaxID=1169540 RepID=A0A0G4ECP4_VITBC|nr:unnamed protein product [Vitrella brassicaformis CCMP3155]|eukprot:CEL93745.1 unnamed protein product [Vitrella brassicaformis CCMP3155]